jgi:hypothetical protein
MRLREHSPELYSVEILKFMGEPDQQDQPFENFKLAEESPEDAGQDAPDALDDLPRNQEAKEDWEDLGDVNALDDNHPEATEELSAVPKKPLSGTRKGKICQRRKIRSVYTCGKLAGSACSFSMISKYYTS